jgi:hypothetical protein
VPSPAKGVPVRFASVGPAAAAKASREGWRLCLRPNILHHACYLPLLRGAIPSAALGLRRVSQVTVKPTPHVISSPRQRTARHARILPFLRACKPRFPFVDSDDKGGAHPQLPLLQPLVRVVIISPVARRSVRERKVWAASGDFHPCLRSVLRTWSRAFACNQCSCRSPQFELRTPGVSGISRRSSGSRRRRGLALLPSQSPV